MQVQSAGRRLLLPLRAAAPPAAPVDTQPATPPSAPPATDPVKATDVLQNELADAEMQLSLAQGQLNAINSSINVANSQLSSTSFTLQEQTQEMNRYKIMCDQDDARLAQLPPQDPQRPAVQQQDQGDHAEYNWLTGQIQADQARISQLTAQLQSLQGQGVAASQQVTALQAQVQQLQAEVAQEGTAPLTAATT